MNRVIFFMIIHKKKKKYKIQNNNAKNKIYKDYTIILNAFEKLY